MKTKQDIAELMNQIFLDLQITREAGQKEYAHSDENAFGNFERLATELQMSREKVLWVYVKKHLDGIVSYINGHKSQREDVRGRIKDVMVYLVLLWGMVDDADALKQADEKFNAAIERFESIPLKGDLELDITKFHNEHIESTGAKKSHLYQSTGEGVLSFTCKNCGRNEIDHREIARGVRECLI